MSSSYALWMRVELSNEYFLGDKGQGIELVPTAATRRLLADARMLVKRVENNLLIITETDGAGKPKVLPDAGTRFTFYLELTDPWVTTVSNVDLDALRGARFHFTNLTGNAIFGGSDPVRHLSRPLPAYEAEQEYQAGTLVTRSGRAFECLKTSKGNRPRAGGSEFWVAKGKAAFVSSGDLVPLRPAFSHFTLQTAASVFQIRVYGLDLGTNKYDHSVLERVVDATDGQDVDQVALDLSQLPATRYRVEINGENFEAFFDDEAKARSALGIVELFHHLDPADAYSPVDGAGLLREVEYRIAFANRRAYWKYFTPLHQVSDIKFTGAADEDPSPFTAGPENDYYLSKELLGLSESPDANLFDLIVAGATRQAPRPDPRMPGVLTHSYDEEKGIWRDPVFNIRLNL